MTPISIPIYFCADETEEERKYRELIGKDLELGIEENPTMPVYFYHITAVSEFLENGKGYGKVFANGAEFLSPYTRDEIIDLISKSWK